MWRKAGRSPTLLGAAESQAHDWILCSYGSYGLDVSIVWDVWAFSAMKLSSEAMEGMSYRLSKSHLGP